MSWFSTRTSMTLFGWILIATVVAGSSTAAATSHAVRVPADAAHRLTALGIEAQHDLDYGSFRWLVVDDSQLARMRNDRLPMTEVNDAGIVQVQGFRFDPVGGQEPVIPERLRADLDRTRLHLVQLVGPVRDGWVTELESSGLQVLQYYPHNTYLVWGASESASSVEAKPWVRWQGPFHPAYKINAGLVGHSGLIRYVDVMFHNDANVDEILTTLASIGAVVHRHAPSQPDRRFYNAIVSLQADRIEFVAQLESVLWLGYASPEPGLDDEMSDQIVAGNHAGGVPFTGYDAHLATLGYDGTGVIWATVDTGVDYDHPDLGPRIVGGYTFPDTCEGPPGNDCPNGGHGTHVSGIIGGDATAGFTDGDGFFYGLGVAPNYSIFAMNSLVGAWPPVGGWQEHSKRAALGNAIGTNNSWWTGSPNHGYQSAERTHDLMVRDGNFDTPDVAEPIIAVFSAGNDGPNPGTLSAPKEAKNLITVASSVNYRNGDIDAISNFSSRGPTVDGRIGITVAAPGEEIASARNDDGGSCAFAIDGTDDLYAFCSGTSMAAPHVSGILALATQWWRGFNGGTDPSPAMVKALVVNSADDMGTADIPNIHEGWGRANLTTLLVPPTQTEYWDQPHTFSSTGQVWHFTVTVDDAAQPLKLTLAWSDAPAAVGANPSLVNDLDLEVMTGGNTYLGSVFADGWSTTGGAPDALDNLENVFVSVPGTTAEITVRATNIAGDGVPYNSDSTDQDFALVCHNCDPSFTLDVSPDWQLICAPNDAAFTVDVGAVAGHADPVLLSATGQPAGTTLNFDTNPVPPGGSTSMTIGNTASGAVGRHTIIVTGTTGSATHSLPVDLALHDSAPDAPIPLSPPNGGQDQPPRLTFTWSAPSQGLQYRLQVATDPDFTDLLVDVEELTLTRYTPDTDFPTNTTLYWKVGSNNTCGIGPWSNPWSFTTTHAAGECPLGSLALTHIQEGFETEPPPGWEHGGILDTWGQMSNRFYSGGYSYHAYDMSAVSDQWLTSVDVSLPEGQLPLRIKFWTWQMMESTFMGCNDGAIVEISTDDGISWTQLDDATRRTGPSHGPITTGSGNPIEGQDAWCGEPQDWTLSVVDLDSYAGETVKFRFRLGTNDNIGREGWYLDDVIVQSCVPGGLLVDGFESGDTSAWSRMNP